MMKAAVIGLLGSLPEGVRKSLLHLSFNIARPEFDRFAHLYAYAPNMVLGLKTLAQRGIQPRTIIDVGAYEGNWSKMARSIWPSANILMFEPNTHKEAIVTEAAGAVGAKLYRDLLGAEDGKEVVFHVMESGSSIMEERSPLERQPERRTLKRLDTAAPSIDGPALLKIDAQGYELEIIKGAERILPRIEAILLEVAIIEINVGAPLLADVTAFMKERGFVACEILEIHRRPLDQGLNQVDILFVRENSTLLADKRHFAARATD